MAAIVLTLHHGVHIATEISKLLSRWIEHFAVGNDGVQAGHFKQFTFERCLIRIDVYKLDD